MLHGQPRFRVRVRDFASKYVVLICHHVLLRLHTPNISAPLTMSTGNRMKFAILRGLTLHIFDDGKEVAVVPLTDRAALGLASDLIGATLRATQDGRNVIRGM